MCTSPRPITIIDKVYGTKRTYVVPCGKCHECLRKKQNEFAVLAVNEALAAKSLHFLTFTYRNSSIPILATYYEEDGNKRTQKFVDDYRSFIISDMSDDHSVVLGVCADSVEYFPSLRRSDVTSFLKRFRTAYNRSHEDFPLDFRYAIFGEYGDKTHRPHYHGLFYDLPRGAAFELSAAWEKEFGYCDLREVNRLNADGSPGFVKVSKYVAKYIAKDKKDYPALIDGLVEIPRRLCSRGFGLRDLDINKLKSFIYVEV